MGKEYERRHTKSFLRRNQRMISDIQAELLELLAESCAAARKGESLVNQPLHTTTESDEAERFFRASYTIFNDQPKLLEHASAVLDGTGTSALKAVCEYTDEQSGQTFWKVASSNKDNKEYLCLSNYCSCQSYLQMARSSEALILCKHMMAVKLAQATGQYNQRLLKRDAYLITLASSH